MDISTESHSIQRNEGYLRELGVWGVHACEWGQVIRHLVKLNPHLPESFIHRASKKNNQSLYKHTHKFIYHDEHKYQKNL